MPSDEPFYNLVVEHETKISENSKADDNVHNDPLKVSGTFTKNAISDLPIIPANIPTISPIPATLRVPQLIEEKIITSAVNSVTFASLNGNSDEEWLLITDIISNSAGDLYLKPNNAVSPYVSDYSLSSTIQSTVSCGAGAPTGYIQLGFGDSAFQNLHSETNIFSKSGKPRIFINKSFFRTNTKLAIENHFYSWGNTADNITSLVCGIDGAGTFTGKIRLYKMVDMVIS